MKKVFTETPEGKAITNLDNNTWETEKFIEDIKQGKIKLYSQDQPLTSNALYSGGGDGACVRAYLTILREYFEKSNEQKINDFINGMFGAMIGGAYQDRETAYSTQTNNNAIENLIRVQDFRHRADRHLISIIQAFKNLNRQPIKVNIKQADSVNIGQNIDKQLNVSKDLDKII